MRRRVVWPDQPPALLLRFKLEDWPAEDKHEAFQQWREARRVFYDVHGWPGGFVDLLQQGYQERQRVFYGDSE